MGLLNRMAKKSALVLVAVMSLVSVQAQADEFGEDPNDVIDRIQWIGPVSQICQINVKKGVVNFGSSIDSERNYAQPSIRRGYSERTVDHQDTRNALAQLRALTAKLYRKIGKDNKYRDVTVYPEYRGSNLDYLHYSLRREDSFFNRMPVRYFWKLDPKGDSVKVMACEALEAIQLVDDICASQAPIWGAIPYEHQYPYQRCLK